MRHIVFATIAAAFVFTSAPAHSEVGEGDRPTLDVETIDGDSVSLEDWRGKVVLVDFWATWCAPCRDSLPFYERLADEHGDAFRILAVSVDEEQSAVEGFLEKRDLSFDVTVDAGHEIAGRFEPPTMPTCYLLGPDGSVAFVHEGLEEGDEDLLAEKIESLVADVTDADSTAE